MDKKPASIIISLLLGLVLILLSIILLFGAFFWFGNEHSLYRLSESVITGMLGCASLLIGAMFIIVSLVLNSIEKNKRLSP